MKRQNGPEHRGSYDFEGISSGNISETKNLFYITFVAGGVDEYKKWASIRDQLRRTIAKRKTKSGQAADKVRKYKYEDIVAFSHK